jgi:hypothetical protein
VKRTTLGRQTNRRGLDLADVRAAHERHRGPQPTPDGAAAGDTSSGPDDDETTG